MQLLNAIFLEKECEMPCLTLREKYKSNCAIFVELENTLFKVQFAVKNDSKALQLAHESKKIFRYFNIQVGQSIR